MTLTGGPLLVTLLVVAVLMPAIVVAGWSRVRGAPWLVLAQRVGLVLVAQLTTLMLAAVALNDYGDFFSSWSQAANALFGSAPRNSLGNQALGDLNSYGAAAPITAVNSATVKVAPSDRLPGALAATNWSTPRQYATRGAVGTMTVDGPESQLSNKVAVYLPPAYFQGERSLPLVEAITGYPATYRVWIDKLRLPAQLDAGIRMRLIGPMVVVMTSAGVPYPLDTECTDAPGGPFAYTYFAKDLPQVARRTLGLRVTAMGALGYSTGGYCAIKLAMLDPTSFRASASMSGYFAAEPGRFSPSLFGGSAQVRHLNDLLWRLRHLPAPRSSVLVMTGTEEVDADGWITNNKFLDAVRAPMHADRFIVPVDFGHSYRTWVQEVAPALMWISRMFGVVHAQGGIGSALFSRQGLHRHRARPVASASAAPSPTRKSSPSPSRTPKASGSPGG